MTFFQTLAGYITGNVDARAKFQVAESTVAATANLEKVLESNDMKLLKDKYTYKVVLKPEHLTKKVFVLYNDAGLDESVESFTILDKKIHPILECSQDLYTIATIQKICDAIFQNPTYNSLQLAIKAGLIECINKKTFPSLSMVNDKEESEGKNALMVAIETQNKDLINAVMCLEGVDMKALDNNGSSYFHYAARISDSAVIKMLATKDETNLNHLNDEGESALHEACRADKPNNVEMLMRWKIDPFLSNAQNYPLHTALHHNCIECVKVLISWKPGILKLKGLEGNSALHMVSDKEIIEFLIEQGCYIEERNSRGLTPLLFFIGEGNHPACMSLLIKGANILARDDKDNGAIHYAVQSGDELMVKMAVVFGADLDLCNKDSLSPRHVAATSDCPKRDHLLYLLNEAGARRCSHDKTHCSEGCKATGTDNGVKPPLKESSQTKIEDVPYIVEEFKVFKSTMEAALARSKKGYLLDNAKKTRANSPGDRILCLDGGGIRGLVSIQVLQALENIAGRPITELFDWIAGTSTGGILTMGIVQRKTLNHMMMSYFDLKNTVFKGKRPYDSEVLENHTKNFFGEYTKMTDITKPKVMLFSAVVDRVPAKLHIFRNYSHPNVPHDPSPSPFKQFPPIPKPEDQYVWQAVRATGAAPTFFRSYGRYLDGGLISNNPTMDCMAEIVKYNEALHNEKPEINTPPIHVVVSVGTGQFPVRFMEDCDIYRPGALWDFSKIFAGAMNIGELMLNQTTSTDGSSITRASSWCNSLQAAYFRFNPPLNSFVALDAREDDVLVQLMWEAHCYLHSCHEQLVHLVQLLI